MQNQNMAFNPNPSYAAYQYNPMQRFQQPEPQIPQMQPQFLGIQGKVVQSESWRYDEMGNDMWRTPEIWAEYNKNATMWNPSNMSKTFISTYGVEDGSFLRLNNLTVGYSLPTKALRFVGMSKCRFYVTGYNLFTVTKYSGYDPEVNIAQGTSPNIDYKMYPRSRTYTFGVQLSF